MALPNTVDTATPPGSEAISLGDNQIRSFKVFMTDVLGIPNATAINNAFFEIVAAGLKSVFMQDAAANPVSNGQLRRNAADLLYHNGVVARSLLGGAITLAATLKGAAGGDHNTASGAFADVDATNLKASVTIPVGAKFLLAGYSIGAAGGASGANKVRILAAGGVICDGFTGAGEAHFTVPMGIIANPTSGAQTIALQYANGGSGTFTIFDTSPELGTTRPIPRMWYIVTN